MKCVDAVTEDKLFVLHSNVFPKLGLLTLKSLKCEHASSCVCACVHVGERERYLTSHSSYHRFSSTACLLTIELPDTLFMMILCCFMHWTSWYSHIYKHEICI